MMTTTRKLIVAFWVVILLMAAWQFYTYNDKLSHPDHPVAQQDHFYFYPPTGPAAPGTPPAKPVAIPGADVRQTGYSVDSDTPIRGELTCHVTLKNFGQSAATDIQVMVRPYRGATNLDIDGGRQNVFVLPDDDPTSLLGQFVEFPDLGPGESKTEDVVMAASDKYKPGTNPNPQILFTAVPASSSTPAPAPRSSAHGGGGD